MAEKNHLTAVLECPTAPFHEEGLARLVSEFAERRGLGLLGDDHGNLLLTYDGGGGDVSALPLGLQAALDAPGFDVVAVAAGQAEVAWHGAVPLERLVGAAMRIFTRHGTARGRVVSMSTRSTPAGERPERLLLQVEGRVRIGDFGVPDLPDRTTEEGWVEARSASGVLGVAAILDLLDRLTLARPPSQVHAFFTRGASADHAGALALMGAGLVRSGTPLVSVHGVPAQPGLAPNWGPVVRVGDAFGLFDARLCRFLAHSARRLEANDPEKRSQRVLADDTASEAGVFAAFGHPTGAVGLAIDSEPRSGDHAGLSTERFSLRDYAVLVDLLEVIAIGWCELRDIDRARRDLARRLSETAAPSIARLCP